MDEHEGQQTQAAASSQTPRPAGNPTPARLCGAKTRAGGTCRQPAMANGRCRMHGGPTPRGPAHPAYKHGRLSKHLPAQLRTRALAALRDPELLSLRESLALLDSRISEQLDEIAAGRNTTANWREVRELIQERRKAANTERLRLVDLQQMITAEQAQGLIAALIAAVTEYVHDEPTRRKIAERVMALVERGP